MFWAFGGTEYGCKILAWARGAESVNHNKGADWLWYLKHGKSGRFSRDKIPGGAKEIHPSNAKFHTVQNLGT